MGKDNRPYEYYAFISYKREDEKWAKWLQKKLEYYKIPVSVRKNHPGIPERIRPVFKDTTDLEPGILALKIKEALGASNFLIVICSPRSANSVWVSKEVQEFIDNGREDHIIPFIISGKPNAENPGEECFPEGLRQLSGEKELLGVNINEMGRDAAAIKVIARMFNIRFDSLWQRYEKNRRKKMVGIGIVAFLALLIAVTTGTLYIDRNAAFKERDKAYEDLNKTYGELLVSNQEKDRLNSSLVEERNNVELMNEKLVEERNNVELMNEKLLLANDSIRKTLDMLSEANKSLDNKNLELTNTVALLARERDNVKQQSQLYQMEQLRLIANQAELQFTDGKVMQAFRTVAPWAQKIVEGEYPYSVEIASLLNKIKCHLSQDGYKLIDRAKISDSYEEGRFFVSQDFRYNPYMENGRFYVYDFYTQTSEQLPGTDRIDDYDIQNADNILFYRGLSSGYWWDLNQKMPLEAFSDFQFGDYDDLLEYQLEDKFEPIEIYLEDLKDISRDYYDLFNYGFGNKYWYHLHNEISSNNRGYVKFSPFSNEIFYYNLLFSSRSVSGIDEFINLSDFKDFPKPGPKEQIYKMDGCWDKIDENAGRVLYVINNESNDGSESDFCYEDGTLLLEDKIYHTLTVFMPFLAFSAGNGIPYLSDAKMLNDNEILCVAGQGSPIIYNLSNKNIMDFQEENLDSWEWGHIGVYLVESFMIDDQTLCTIRTNGQITFYDISTGLIFDEYASDYLDLDLTEEELYSYNYNRYIEKAFFLNNSIFLEDGKGRVFKLPVRDRIHSLKDDLNAIEKFWR